MNLQRRDILKGGLTALGFLALPGTPMFAAPLGWKTKKKPNLILGILSDTHLMVEWDGKSLYRSMTLAYIRNAFKLFKARGIDAFVHLGDASQRGCVREWEFHREVYDEVFGKKDAPEKIIIVGNHELMGNDGHCKGVYRESDVWRENAICADVARHYERMWGEPYAENFHREVKGYHFFGRHWTDAEYKGTGEKPFSGYILSNADACSLKGTKPFFILSHRRHHFFFCQALKDFPNAVAFMGHWHQSNADWKSIYFDRDTFGGFFPHIQVGACRYDGQDGMFPPDEIKLLEDSSSWKCDNLPSRQAMIVNVFDDMVVFERHEVGQGGKLGPDWVMPLDWGTGNGEGGTVAHPFSRAELKEAIGEPQFARNAKLKAEAVKLQDGGDAVRLSIPLADGNPDSRVYAYDVVVVGEDPKEKLFKSVYWEGVNAGIGHEPEGGVTTLEIPKSELPAGRMLTIAVRPVSSLGTRGRAIAAKFAHAPANRG